MRPSNRKAIQDLVPEDYTMEDGTEFKVQKIVGGREDPLAEIPFIAMTWGDPTPNPKFRMRDVTGVVTVWDYVSSHTGAIDGFAYIYDEDDRIEIEFTPGTTSIYGIELHISEIGSGNRVHIRLYRKQNEQWIEIGNTWKWNHSIVRNGYTVFPLTTLINPLDEFKIEIEVWDFDQTGAYLKVGTVGGIPLYRVIGKTGTTKRYGRIENIDLDFGLFLGDIGLLGGKKISSTDIAWTIYKTLVANSWGNWDAVIVAGSVNAISGLRRVGGYGEETDWNFTVGFRFEHSTISTEPRYPISRIDLKKVYIKQ